ncbi:SigB/SigF/SigG family RNA polymerase sigma factor [Kitasatospora sp. NBC_00315]
MAPGDARELSKVLFVRLRAVDEGGPEYSYVRGTLIELNLSLVRFAAGRFRGRSESMEDILQVGTVGLIKAIDRFAPERDVEFSTYALPTITGEIKRFFRDTSWAVHVPRRLQELRLSLARATDVLEQDLERAPTVRELAEHLRLEEEEVVEGLGASNAYTAGSLDAQTQADGAEGSIADRLGRPDDAMDAVEDLESLRPLIARLPERERAILSLRFVGDMTQSEIGRRLGMSQMHVSRLLSHALRSLREGLLCEE